MNKKVDISRRRTTGLLLKTMALSTLANLVKIPGAVAQDLPHVKLDDPTAVALKYVEDASQADRPDKSGVPGSEQDCLNCQFAQGADGDWIPCLLFPGKSVAAKGWCSNWTKKM